MEFINKIELQGIVGSVQSREVGSTTLYRFSVHTELASKDAEDQILVDCTWFNCLAYEGNNISRKVLELLQKGTKVYLKGRIRTRGYVGSDGIERNTFEVVCNSLQLVDD